MVKNLFVAGTLTWKDPVHSWKAGPGEVMTGKFIYLPNLAYEYTNLSIQTYPNLELNRNY